MKERLIIASKHKIYREALARLLERKLNIAKVNTCGSEFEVIETTRKNHPSIIIVDIESSECIEALHRIHERQPETKVIVISDSQSIADFIAASRAGARAYISKDIGVENLVRVIPLISAGKLIASPGMASEVLAELNSVEERKNAMMLAENKLLSERERGVLALVEQGLTDREIAISLFISENTVKVHLRNIRTKLHARNRQQAVSLARAKGVLPTTTLR